MAVSPLTLETCGDTIARKALDWDSDGESWTGSEGASSSEQCEHNVESLALNVMGQIWSGEEVSLFAGGLGTCECGLELPQPLTCCARKCMRPGSWVAAAREALFHSKESLSLSPWTVGNLEGGFELPHRPCQEMDEALVAGLLLPERPLCHSKESLSLCYNERRVGEGEQLAKADGVEGDYRAKSIPWQAVEGFLGWNNCARDV